MATMESILAELQKRIERANAVNIDANVEDFHANISMEELARILREPGLEVGGMCFTKPGHPVYKKPHVFIHPRSRETLCAESPLQGLSIRNIGATAAAIEEVSHWVYDTLHKERFGRYSHSAAAELIGAVDKYNILKSFVGNQDLEEEIRRMSFETDHLLPGHRDRTPSYLVAHKLAKNFIDHLNTISRGDAADAMVTAYHLEDRELLKYLIFDIKLRVDNLSRQENDRVIRLLKDLGL